MSEQCPVAAQVVPVISSGDSMFNEEGRHTSCCRQHRDWNTAPETGAIAKFRFAPWGIV